MRAAALAAVALALGAGACTERGAAPVVSEAWISEAPPGTTTVAGYLTIDNPGPAARTLESVSSPRADSVHLHRTEMRDGVARMAPVEQLPVPPGGRLQLAPGGLHLMIGVREPAPRAGEQFPLVLHFDAGERVAVDAAVRRAGSGHQHRH